MSPGVSQRSKLVLMMLVISQLSVAQFGVKGGIALSGFQPHSADTYYSGDDYRPFLGYEVDWLQSDNSYPDLGFQIGGFYNRSLTPRTSLQPEIFVAQRGLNFVYREIYNTVYYLNVTYLQVPLLVRHDLTTTRKIKPGFYTGPYGSITLSSNRKTDIWGEKSKGDVTGISPWDAGWVFGFITEWDAFSGRMSAEFRIDWGLHSVMYQPDEYKDMFNDPGKVRLLAMTIMTGYRFGKNDNAE